MSKNTNVTNTAKRCFARIGCLAVVSLGVLVFGFGHTGTQAATQQLVWDPVPQDQIEVTDIDFKFGFRSGGSRGFSKFGGYRFGKFGGHRFGKFQGRDFNRFGKFKRHRFRGFRGFRGRGFRRGH